MRTDTRRNSSMREKINIKTKINSSVIANTDKKVKYR